MFVVRQIAVASVLATAPDSALPSVHLYSPMTSVMVERVDVGAKSIQIEPLLSRLELTLRSGSARGLEGKSRLCPHLIADSDPPTLRCTTQSFGATLDPKSGAITLVALRGLPWQADSDGPPRWSYDPDALPRPLSCPGATVAARAECAFQAGKLDRAFEELSTLKDGPSRGFAALRLGDIALALDDPERALAAFAEASKPSSPVASLATLRRCELVDDCMPPMLDPRTYPEVLRPEARLRIARQRAFHGKWEAVLELLSEIAKTKPASESNRAEQVRLQRRLLIGALTIPSGTGGTETTQDPSDDDRLTHALELYLKDPDRLTGTEAENLTDAAAEAAAHLGSPRFGAHILAAIFPIVADKHRANHLLRTAELYLDDDDAVHTEAILEFARTRLPAEVLRAPRWRQVVKRLKQIDDHGRADEALTERLKKNVELAREISEAMRVSASAKQHPEGRP